MQWPAEPRSPLCFLSNADTHKTNTRFGLDVCRNVVQLKKMLHGFRVQVWFLGLATFSTSFNASELESKIVAEIGGSEFSKLLMVIQ